MVTNDDPYVAIDLDHCIENGQLSETATEFVSQLNGTYIERSRSKTGLHIFCKANLVEGNFNNNGVEMYRENKPIAMTGDSRCKYFQPSIEIKERAQKSYEILSGTHSHIILQTLCLETCPNNALNASLQLKFCLSDKTFTFKFFVILWAFSKLMASSIR